MSPHWRVRQGRTTCPSAPPLRHSRTSPTSSQPRRAPLPSQATTPRTSRRTSGTDTTVPSGCWSRDPPQATSPTTPQVSSRVPQGMVASSQSPTVREASWDGMLSRAMPAHTAPRWMLWRPRCPVWRPLRQLRTRPSPVSPLLRTTPSPQLRVPSPMRVPLRTGQMQPTARLRPHSPPPTVPTPSQVRLTPRPMPTQATSRPCRATWRI